MRNTPLARARCNSMMAYIGLKGQLNDWAFEDDDVIRKLIFDNKIRYRGQDLVLVPGAERYTNDNTNPDNHAHPLVLQLAEENPVNEQFVRVYRKNLDYCPLTLPA